MKDYLKNQFNWPLALVTLFCSYATAAQSNLTHNLTDIFYIGTIEGIIIGIMVGVIFAND